MPMSKRSRGALAIGPPDPRSRNGSISPIATSVSSTRGASLAISTSPIVTGRPSASDNTRSSSPRARSDPKSRGNANTPTTTNTTTPTPTRTKIRDVLSNFTTSGPSRRSCTISGDRSVQTAARGHLFLPPGAKSAPNGRVCEVGKIVPEAQLRLGGGGVGGAEDEAVHAGFGEEEVAAVGGEAEGLEAGGAEAGLDLEGDVAVRGQVHRV